MISPQQDLSSLANTLTGVAGALRSAAAPAATGMALFDDLQSDSDDDLSDVPRPAKARPPPTGLTLFHEQKLSWRSVDLAEWALENDPASAFVRYDDKDRVVDSGVLEQTAELTPSEHQHLQRNLAKYVIGGSSAVGFRVLHA